MKPALDAQLCQRYPYLYRDRHSDMTKTQMYWGFSCGDGWFMLIDSLSTLLATHAPDAVASQVKEKFGGLRFYYRGGGDMCGGMTAMAEYLSHKVCEVCGEPGDTHNTGWVVTRCAKHVEQQHLGGSSYHHDIQHVHGLGLGWSRLITHLEALIAWDTEKNHMPPSTLSVSKTDGRLYITVVGGDDRTAGMVALVNDYANRIDEYSGVPDDPFT